MPRAAETDQRKGKPGWHLLTQGTCFPGHLLAQGLPADPPLPWLSPPVFWALQAAATSGDGYRGQTSPHTPSEKFYGVTVFKALKVESGLSVLGRGERGKLRPGGREDTCLSCPTATEGGCVEGVDLGGLASDPGMTQA